jgi:RNA polymerase sigma factor (sigma-70 family)
MDSRTDQELLREYAAGASEAAFSELVRRYIDLVYSAALRLVGNVHLAEDVSQKVFLALAQNAGQLADRAVLPGWLHGTAHNLSANAIRSEVRRRAREQEAAAMNELLAPEPEPLWESVAPFLDAGLSQLSEPDRDALLLRYFQHKSAQEIAQLLGISGEAAQKRVNRAVGRLREFLAKQGIVVGAGALIVLIGTNAVQAAPVGLALTVSTAVLSTACLQTTTVIASTKIIAMTTIQKALIAAAAVAALGTGIYQARQTLHRRGHLQTVELRQPMTTERQSLLPSVPDPSPNTEPAGPSRPRPTTRSPQVARPRSAASSGGFTSTELYALLTNKASRLTLAQVEPYLNARERNASSLLAAFRTTGDPALLAEALQKYPGDPHVGFEVATRADATAAERRAGLDAFKQAAPDNSLANYLSALDYFKTGHKVEAVQELNAAAAKPLLQDYTTDRIRSDEEVYLTAGYPPGEAQMIANTFLTEAQLVHLRELGQNLVELASDYQAAGDQSSREVALQMALNLGRRFDDPAAGETMRWQLIGIRIERAALAAMDPGSPVPGTGQPVQDRLNQLAGQMQSIQALTRQADPIWKTLSDQDWTEYHNQIAASGEEAAVRWLMSNYGQR